MFNSSIKFLFILHAVLLLIIVPIVEMAFNVLLGTNVSIYHMAGAFGISFVISIILGGIL